MNEITLAQIVNGTLDPSWVMVILGGIVAFFLVRTLTKIEKNSEKITERLDKMQEIQVRHSEQIHQINERINGEEGPKWAEILLDRIASITPPGPRRKRETNFE